MADGTIIIDTRINTDGIDDGINEVKKGLDLGDVIKGSAIGSAITGLVQNIVSNVGEIGKAFIESAAEVKAQGSQFEQAFGNMQEAAHNAISGIADNSGILETRLNTLGSQIYSFARASGGDTAEALDLMKLSLQAAADGAAYYDRSLEDTTASLQSFLKGNFENDAALGLSATEATRNAEAYELFGKKFKDLTEIQKQQTLLQMVLDAQELSGAMGQAARESEGWENVQGNLNESIRQFQAAAGEPFLAALVPTVQKLTNGIAGLTKNADWDGFSKGIKTLVNAFEEGGLTGFIDSATEMGAEFVNNLASGLAGNVTALINKGLPMLLDFTKSLRANVGTLIDAGIDFVLQIAKGFADGLPAFFQTVPEMISNLAGLINDNAPKLLIAGGKLILTLLKGLWDALPDILMSIPDMIIAIVDVFTAFNWMNLGKNIMTFLKDGIQSMVGAIKTTATSVKTNIVDMIKGLPAQLQNIASNGMTGMINGIRGLLGSLKSAAGQVLSNIVNAISGLPGKLLSLAKTSITNMKNAFTNGGWKNLGKAIIDGIVTGISGAASKLLNSLKNLAKSALNSAKKALGIHSPSREFRDVIGKMIPLGITEGIDDEFPGTIKTLKSQAKSLIETASGLVPDIMEYSMPVMATGTVVPASTTTEPYYSYIGSLFDEIKELKGLLTQKENRKYSNEEMRLIIQLNRRVLFDEFVEEYNLRRLQGGAEPLPV
jgi:phage-related protein